MAQGFLCFAIIRSARRSNQLIIPTLIDIVTDQLLGLFVLYDLFMVCSISCGLHYNTTTRYIHIIPVIMFYRNVLGQELVKAQYICYKSYPDQCVFHVKEEEDAFRRPPLALVPTQTGVSEL